MRLHPTAQLLACAAIATSLGLASSRSSAQQAPPHAFFRIRLGSAAAQPLSGRLLVFLKPGKGDAEVDVQEFHPRQENQQTWVAAQEVRDLAPGASVQFDADLIAYPRPFSALPPGDYEVRAVLDTDHSYQLLRPHPPPGLDQSGGEPDAVEPAKPGGDPYPERTSCAQPAAPGGTGPRHAAGEARRDRAAGDG